MLASRFSTLLCASLALAAGGAADASEPFVVQLRLPARDLTVDVFASRSAAGIEAPGSALARLGIAAPNTDDLILLSSIGGLSFEERPDEGAIVITCAMACYETQHVDVGGHRPEPQAANASDFGGYVNYDVALQWIEDRASEASGVAEAALFGDWGLIKSSWLGRSGDDARFTRLESSWTIDQPRRGIRARVGDSVFFGATGAPVRFGGLQIGRHLGLTPSLITYPTPAFAGEAESASTIELYVDGALRAQSEVAAGPFVIDHAAVVSGAGEAELVITDILGRQQTITRPFFVSTEVLRRGLSDWSVAIGAERRAFGRESNRYGDTFAALRYRRGLTNALTLEAAAEATGETTTLQAGVTIAGARFGQAYVSRAANDAGGFTSASWHYDGRFVSLGAQIEQRDGDFEGLGREHESFREGVAGNVALNLGDHGALTLTAAQVSFDDEPRGRTLTLSYTPDFGDGALSLRLVHTEREDSELAAGVSFSFALAGDVSGHANIEHDRRGMTYRASAQRAVEPGRLGWRARGSAGAVERAEVAAMARGALGDTIAELGVANGVGGVRLRHAGSVGWVERLPFAGRRIEGAFALVDGGAPDISVARNRLDAGETGADGRRLVTNLAPYRSNAISIDADDLPIDRAPATPVQHVAVAEGAGAFVRFAEARQRLLETHVVFASGGVPPRGAVLVRSRDERRFPVGTDGRVVLQGVEDGDALALGPCIARGDATAAALGLVLVCATS